MKLMYALLGSGLALGACVSEPDIDSTVQDLGNGNSTELNTHPRHHPTNQAGHTRPGSSNLVNHGGPVITNAHVVPIFWGPSWSAGDAGIASSIVSYVGRFGTSGEYNTITQYSGIQLSNLAGGAAAWYDSSTPPTNATDAAIQGEVNKYLSTHAFDANAIYEVFLPSTSYSSDGTSTSCGGPSLAYCAYHSNYTSSHGDTRYASMPYPSCGGCQSAGFSATQNFEHFISHETREAVTDADGTAWWDSRGNEADDKCAWTPSPFGDSAVGTNNDGTAFAFQYEWSNANSGCIQRR
ncbi:MAG: hypothetical protein JO257_29720 [Deltaproteobacteria bacterium]|nr:hypothetical protein [Deltaproteobacteria bacterium]